MPQTVTIDRTISLHQIKSALKEYTDKVDKAKDAQEKATLMHNYSMVFLFMLEEQYDQLLMAVCQK